MGTPRRVLVVEDDRVNRELVVELVEQEGHKALSADSAREGLVLAVRKRPDLILMDIGLPGMSGYEATRRLKADPATASIPVVALTGLAMRGEEAEALRAGCDAYLTKPIDTEAFWETLRRFLGPRPRASM